MKSLSIESFGLLAFLVYILQHTVPTTLLKDFLLELSFASIEYITFWVPMTFLIFIILEFCVVIVFETLKGARYIYQSIMTFSIVLLRLTYLWIICNDPILEPHDCTKLVNELDASFSRFKNNNPEKNNLFDGRIELLYQTHSNNNNQQQSLLEHLLAKNFISTIMAGKTSTPSSSSSSLSSRRRVLRSTKSFTSTANSKNGLFPDCHESTNCLSKSTPNLKIQRSNNSTRIENLNHYESNCKSTTSTSSNTTTKNTILKGVTPSSSSTTRRVKQTLHELKNSREVFWTHDEVEHIPFLEMFKSYVPGFNYLYTKTGLESIVNQVLEERQIELLSNLAISGDGGEKNSHYKKDYDYYNYYYSASIHIQDEKKTKVNRDCDRRNSEYQRISPAASSVVIAVAAEDYVMRNPYDVNNDSSKWNKFKYLAFSSKNAMVESVKCYIRMKAVRYLPKFLLETLKSKD